MKIRRCAALFFEPREISHFDLGSLLSGGNGLVRKRSWVALAPHLDGEVTVSDEELLAIGKFSPENWVELEEPMNEITGRLLERGLLLSNDDAHGEKRRADERYRALHWWPLAAVAHRAARWEAVNSVESMQRLGTDSVAGLLRTYGMPPPATTEREVVGFDVPLERNAVQPLDALMSRRVTCRNFDVARTLEQPLFSRMLERVFAAQGHIRREGGVEFLKKHTPSGGGLHATEAYLLVQRVEGIVPGLYHYRPVDHALRPLPTPGMPLDEFACNVLAGQHWFAHAPVLVVYAPRIARSHWKYRNHSKAWRALMLDVGHLSQTLYLSATDLGLGAFVTAAINEAEIECAFGLEPLRDGPLAVGGFGWRSEQQEIAELDPAGQIWPQA